MQRREAMRLALALAALVLAAGPAAADPAGECAANASKQHSDEITELWNSPESQPLPSVEAVLKKRRLQEAYCLKETGCLYGSPTSNATDLSFRAEFARCLDEEAALAK